MNIKIIIASHKQYWVPKDDVYLPLHVGKKGKKNIGLIGDDTGDNISGKNSNYCELTGLYWAWKNLEADYIGLVHYRRYFTHKDGHNNEDKKKYILQHNDWLNLLGKCDIIVPKKRKYYIETNYSHYAHAHNKFDLDKTRDVIKKSYPEYLDSFDQVMKQTSAHMFNMFVMKKDKFDVYCKWLFSILFELENRIDISSYNTAEARVFGYISELLLDVWLDKNNFTYKEVNVTFMEKQNWLKKGTKFLLRKFNYTKD